ncbi:SDR family NAD(P)-dependent oxidoreductase [Oceanobacillus senegalensis]|uniref:SDR family NAD(P)-dependent oxidoreductase n=1 Tax=Oceanobacillus senegalensis TaxID=1936063 RepID=UPI000A30605B|nr:SDR family oxidoreductase [Oceanobacillus senegalensis]
MSYEGKTFIITGASGGMGKATVDLLLEAGANVVGCDLNVGKLREYEQNARFLAVEGNLLEEVTVKRVFKEASEHFGEISGLVNIAGIAQPATPIEEVSLEDFHKIVDINLTMSFLTCREAAKYMKKQKSGKIVNIGSVSKTRPRPGLQSYIASKGAIESFTKALALELADHQINVNILHPGPADTSMLGKFTKADGDVDEARKEIFEKSVPLGRLIQPNDIANSIKFLLSDEASMITGTVLHVDGGRNL